MFLIHSWLRKIGKIKSTKCHAAIKLFSSFLQEKEEKEILCRDWLPTRSGWSYPFTTRDCLLPARNFPAITTRDFPLYARDCPLSARNCPLPTGDYPLPARDCSLPARDYQLSVHAPIFDQACSIEIWRHIGFAVYARPIRLSKNTQKENLANIPPQS